MVKRSAPKSPQGGTDEPAFNPSDIKDMETLALEKANKAISAIETALASWEASPAKPEDLTPRIVKLKYFYEAITRWEKKMLKSMGKKEQISERVERLKEFGEICYAYT